MACRGAAVFCYARQWVSQVRPCSARPPLCPGRRRGMASFPTRCFRFLACPATAATAMRREVAATATSWRAEAARYIAANWERVAIEGGVVHDAISPPWATRSVRFPCLAARPAQPSHKNLPTTNPRHKSRGKRRRKKRQLAHHIYLVSCELFFTPHSRCRARHK